MNCPYQRRREAQNPARLRRALASFPGGDLQEAIATSGLRPVEYMLQLVD